MAIDTRRVILAAVEAAIDDVMSAAPKPKGKKRRGLPPGRAILLGAGVVTAARVATGSRSRKLLDSVQERLADFVEDGAAG
jgi:hypothetical protein